MIRRYGEAPLGGQRYTPRPGIYAIIAGPDGILLTHQDAPAPEFQLPGGGIDPGEHPLPALHREVFEETGWTITAPRRLGAFRRFTYMPDYDLWAEKICHIYLASPGRRIGPPSEVGHTALWTSPETALKLLFNDGDRAFLAGLLR